MLRNVDRLQFEDPGRTISSKLQSELKLVIQSSNPVQYVFKLYTRLLHYAQAFERHEFTRFLMEMPGWCSRSEFASQSRDAKIPKNQNVMSSGNHDSKGYGLNAF